MARGPSFEETTAARRSTSKAPARLCSADRCCRGRTAAALTTPAPAGHAAGMPSDSSFDIVSEIDLQEMDNAVSQAIKEVTTRYDFKGSSAGISELNRKEKELTLTADA